jgi:hypothetical protein
MAINRSPWAALALLVALGGCASEPWDRTDLALGFTALGATIADWGQARYIAEHPAQFADKNPILGRHPARGKVDAYFICAMGGGYLLADALPGRYRKLFLGGATIVEISTVRHNRSIGVGFRW